MFVEERLHAIRRLVREAGRLDFATLQGRMKVSPATLRRDLGQLEKRGDVIRVHGGVLAPGYLRLESSLNERRTRHRAGKKAMAATVARLVPPGATVLIDAGSTCLEAGQALLGRKDLRIITHSVALVEAGLRGAADLWCLGGSLRRVSGALIGAAALGALGAISADVALIGASGLEAETGAGTTELSEADMKQALLARARRRILVADHTKWDRPSTVRFARWEAFTDWVTDEPPAPATLRRLRTRGLVVHFR